MKNNFWHCNQVAISDVDPKSNNTPENVEEQDPDES